MRLNNLIFSFCAVLAMGLSSVNAGTISVNFTESPAHANQQIASTTTAGLAGYEEQNWNNVAGVVGGTTNLKNENGVGGIASIDVTWASSNVWGDGSANADANAGNGNAQLQRGYLDDGPNPGSSILGVDVQVTDIPYARYDVILYFSSDDRPTKTYENYFVNGQATSGGTIQSWGSNSSLTLGLNVARVANVTGSTLNIEALKNQRGLVRSSLSGFQIVAVPEPSTIVLMVFAGLGLIGFRSRK